MWDDWLKVHRRRGLRARVKLGLQILLTLALVHVTCECEKRCAERVWLGLFALGRGEGDFVAGVEDLLERLGQFHEEVAGVLAYCFSFATGVVEWK